MSIHWEVMTVLVERSGNEFGERFRARGIRDERRITRRGNLDRVVELAEAPRAGYRDIGGIEARPLQPRLRPGRGGLEPGERRLGLPDDAVEPRLVRLPRRT